MVSSEFISRQYLETGKFLTQWEKANAVPLYETDDKKSLKTTV